MPDDDMVLPRRGKKPMSVDTRAHDPNLLELGYLRLAMEEMGDLFPRLTRLVVRSFASKQINPNDLAECRLSLTKAHQYIHFKKLPSLVDPKHINNSKGS